MKDGIKEEGGEEEVSGDGKRGKKTERDGGEAG